MTMSEVPTHVPDTCPVVHFDNSRNQPVGGYFQELDEMRELAPAVWNTFGQGFWVVTRFDDQRAAYQDYETFTSESIIAVDPDPQYMWIPTLVDGPDHTQYRRLLNGYFSPANVAKREEQNREIARKIIEELKAKGSCDLAHEFCGEFPTRAFFALAGFDQKDAPRMVELVTTIFDQMSNPDDHSAQAAAAGEISEYFAKLLDDRRANPRDTSTDLTSHLLTCTFNGEPLTQETLLNILGVIILAGLDTMKCQLGYSFYHLATFPEDRQRILDDPSLIPSFVEESLRYYTIVQPARKLGKDVEFAGCPMKKGEMVLLDLAQSCRDPEAFPEADKFIIDRQNNKHLAFGPGAHRCMGSHLARQELVIAIEEWHKAIPNYELTNTEPLTEHGGQRGVNSIPVRWDI